MNSVSPFVPGRCTFDAGQHQVHDVVLEREIVIAARDENLRALDPIAVAAGHFRRGRRGRAHVAASVRLGEAHRATPTAVEHAREVLLVLLRRPERFDDLGRAERQPGIHVERGVGAALQLLHEHPERLRGASAAVLGGDPDALPTRVEQLLPGFFETLRGHHAAVLDLAALEVTGDVEGTGDLLHPAITLVHHRPDLVLAPRLERFLAEQALNLELLEQEKHHLPKIGLVAIDGLNGLGHDEAPRVGMNAAEAAIALRMNAHSVYDMPRAAPSPDRRRSRTRARRLAAGPRPQPRRRDKRARSSRFAIVSAAWRRNTTSSSCNGEWRAIASTPRPL